MSEILRTSINGLQRLRIYYEPGWRIVEPHAYGRGSSGQFLLRAYQVEGASASNEHEHWKLFRVDRIEAIELDDSDFDGPREGYKENDKAMKLGIIAQLRNRTGRVQ